MKVNITKVRAEASVHFDITGSVCLLYTSDAADE